MKETGKYCGPSLTELSSCKLISSGLIRSYLAVDFGIALLYNYFCLSSFVFFSAFFIYFIIYCYSNSSNDKCFCLNASLIEIFYA